jgi:hypothetical protein
MLKSLLLVNSLDEQIKNFTDDDISERYIAALIVIADFHEISVNDAHHGISDMLDEIELDINRDTEPETKTRH